MHHYLLICIGMIRSQRVHFLWFGMFLVYYFFSLVDQCTPQVGWLKRNLNSLKVSKTVLQQYGDVVENDAVMTGIQESIGDIWKRNKKAECASLDLLKALQCCQGACLGGL
jgi:hypothetical protein